MVLQITNLAETTENPKRARKILYTRSTRALLQQKKGNSRKARQKGKAKQRQTNSACGSTSNMNNNDLMMAMTIRIRMITKRILMVLLIIKMIRTILVTTAMMVSVILIIIMMILKVKNLRDRFGKKGEGKRLSMTPAPTCGSGR